MTEAGFGAYNDRRPIQALCGRHPGGSRTLCDRRFRTVRGVVASRARPVHERTLSRSNESPVPGAYRDTRTRKPRQADLRSAQFVAKKRWRRAYNQPAIRLAEGRESALRGRGLGMLTLPCISRTPTCITGSGVWELPWLRNERSIAGYLWGAGRSRRVRLTERQPGHARNVDWCRASARPIALRGRRGSYLGVKAVLGQRMQQGRYDCIPLDRSWMHGDLLPDPRGLQRRTAMNRYDEFAGPRDDARRNFATTTRHRRVRMQCVSRRSTSSKSVDERPYHTDPMATRAHQPQLTGSRVPGLIQMASAVVLTPRTGRRYRLTAFRAALAIPLACERYALFRFLSPRRFRLSDGILDHRAECRATFPGLKGLACARRGSQRALYGCGHAPAGSTRRSAGHRPAKRRQARERDRVYSAVDDR